MIVQAPGKIVLWGEYAVLAGAPAAVMAVDRYASVQLQPTEHHWRFVSQGFLTAGAHLYTPDYTPAPAAQMAQAVLKHWGCPDLSRPFALRTDTSAFFHANRQKLGLGSSAAACTATYSALARLLERPAESGEAIAVHRAFQDGRGSGLDVMASWLGGVIEFQEGRGKPMVWPQQWSWRVVWSGASAGTAASLKHFGAWRERAEPGILNRLGDASTALCQQPELSQLAVYTECLRALDRAAELNIFTPSHQRLATIAAAHGLVYKPCGAGGGDIGLACGTDEAALAAFSAAAAAENFVPLDLEIAPHGVKFA